MSDLTANERVCRCGKSLASKRTNGCHTIGCTFGDASSSKERVTAKELADLRELVKFGSAIGVGGSCLASLLDEIERLQQRVKWLQEWKDACEQTIARERAAEPPNGNLLQQIAHWANQIPEAGPIRALLAETKTVSQKLDEAGFKRRPLESLDSDSDETPESMPIDQFVAELEKDPEWKEALDEARRDR